MEKSKKRKRDSALPRISYHTSFRTFDRLFKEESLSGMKEIVRRKLDLGSDVFVHLSQIREGETVDLEDDDDFDAFRAFAHSTSVVHVRVNIRGPDNEIAPSTTSKPAVKHFLEGYLLSSILNLSQVPDFSNGKDESQVGNENVADESGGETINSEMAAAETLPVLNGAALDGRQQKKRRNCIETVHSAKDSSGTREITGPGSLVASSAPSNEVEVYASTSFPTTVNFHKKGRGIADEHSTVSQNAIGSRSSATKQSEQRRKTVIRSRHTTIPVQGADGPSSDAAENHGAVARELIDSHDQSRGHQKKLKTCGSQSLDGAAIEARIQKVLAARRMSEAETSPQRSSMSSASEPTKRRKKTAVTSGSRLAQDADKSCVSLSSPTTGSSGCISFSPKLRKPRPRSGSENSSTCPICLVSPSHDQEECPITLENSEAARKHLYVPKLKANKTGGRLGLIAELLGQHEKQRASASVESRSSDRDNDSHDDPTKEVHEPPSLSGFHNPLDDMNLDALIRGPKLRVSDMRSPESSDEEQTQELEEDESESRRRFRNIGTSESSEYEQSSDDDSYEGLARAKKVKDNFVLALNTDHATIHSTVGEASICGPALVQVATEIDARSSSQGTTTGLLQLLRSSTSLIQPSSVQLSSDLPWPEAFARPTVLPTRLASEPVVSPPPTIPASSTPMGRDSSDVKPKIIVRMRSRTARETDGVRSLSLQKMSPPSGTYLTQSSLGQRGMTRSITPSIVPDNAAPVLPARLERHRANSRQGAPSDATTSTPFSAWATLNPPSSTPADGDSTMMIDELEPSSPLPHPSMDVDIPNDVERKDNSRDGSAVPAEIRSPQSEDATQNGGAHDPISNDSDDENEVEAAVQQSKAKAESKVTVKYRRLTDITSDHGLFSTPVNIQPPRPTTDKNERGGIDMYGRTVRDEIESESDSESEDSDTKEQSHIPKARRAGGMRIRKK